MELRFSGQFNKDIALRDRRLSEEILVPRNPRSICGAWGHRFLMANPAPKIESPHRGRQVMSLRAIYVRILIGAGT